MYIIKSLADAAWWLSEHKGSMVQVVQLGVEVIHTLVLCAPAPAAERWRGNVRPVVAQDVVPETLGMSVLCTARQHNH